MTKCFPLCEARESSRRKELMRTEETIQLAYNAQSKREESWDGSNYKLTIDKAVKAVAPPCFSKAEIELASLLNYVAWNEVQELYHGDWKAQG